MNPGKRRRKQQINLRRKRARKNVSFRALTGEERRRVEEQELSAIRDTWVRGKDAFDVDGLLSVESLHNIKFKPLLQKLQKRFPFEKLGVLDEGAGRSSLKEELLRSELGKGLRITTTDVRKNVVPDRVANVLGLVGEFGKNKFHLVVSTAGGALYTPAGEKALFQIVSVLKPGGIGIVDTSISNERLHQLAKRLNFSIQKIHSHSVVFTKNFGISGKK
ncbi:MAG: hypothetical protein JW744_02410 [Candidatus Diapherotrites archaeon]|uniref:Methyltransferase domain-containing protein n=1 Tax=Candidatus Iainarchaeum sp. TaxID=3101447 RepID=A0A939CA22_9ARCH|nr:hypothetical protein [Candidatus Diapherotrites archaeon]